MGPITVATMHSCILTGPQLDPATRAVTSPPSLLAAVMALRVIGNNVLSSCSATTNVDAFLA